MIYKYESLGAHLQYSPKGGGIQHRVAFFSKSQNYNKATIIKG